VVLQHEFWDFEANEEGFAVTLSFGKVRERLFVPYDAVTLFADPAVDFTMKFPEVAGSPADRKPATPEGPMPPIEPEPTSPAVKPETPAPAKRKRRLKPTLRVG